MSQFTYVEMCCDLDPDEIPAGDVPSIDNLVVKPAEGFSPEELYGCYTSAFSAGDAKFYQLQGEEERRRYFEQELGFPNVLTNPASMVYKIGEEIIGFSLVHSYLENNYHISCMCISPDYQNLGLGKSMLCRVKRIALENGCQSITLGTEPDMKAFYLYSQNGFFVTDEHMVEM